MSVSVYKFSTPLSRSETVNFSSIKIKLNETKLELKLNKEKSLDKRYKCDCAVDFKAGNV